MTYITANDIKTKGVGAIEALLAQQSEAIVSVRGKERFVVMNMAQYHYLRECELDAALAQTQTDIAAGNAERKTISEHLATLAMINAST